MSDWNVSCAKRQQESLQTAVEMPFEETSKICALGFKPGFNQGNFDGEEATLPCLGSNSRQAYNSKRPTRKSARGMTGVTSTYPKSSREYMSAKKDGPVPEREMKGGVKEGDYGGEGEV